MLDQLLNAAKSQFGDVLQNNNVSLNKADDLAKLSGEAVKDGASYTDIEKDTMSYIRENFKWTDAADDWFRTEIRKWAASK